jgi:large subunit ribosomal protein L22
MRRFHPRGRGRSAPVTKSFSHITVVVRETAEEPAKETA